MLMSLPRLLVQAKKDHAVPPYLLARSMAALNPPITGSSLPMRADCVRSCVKRSRALSPSPPKPCSGGVGAGQA